MHQLRIVVDNQYNPEAQNDEGISPFEVSHETFMKLVRPAVGYIANADAMAILKRAAFIVFTEKYIYFRPPSEKALPVKFLLWPNPPCKDILVADCKPTLSNWKQGGPQPANYAEMVAWECEWLKELFRRHDEKSRPHACPPARASTTPLLDALLTADGCPPAAPSHASLALASSSSHPVFPAVVPGIMKVEAEEHKDGHAWLARETADDPVDVDTDRASDGWSVKQEKAPVFRSLPFQATGIIELDTPSPPRSKMQVTLKMTQCRLLDVHRRTASVALALRVVSRMFAWCWLCRALVFLLHVIEMAPFPFLMVTVFSFHMAFSYSRELPVPPCQMAATSSSTRLSIISLQSRLMKVSL